MVTGQRLQQARRTGLHLGLLVADVAHGLPAFVRAKAQHVKRHRDRCKHVPDVEPYATLHVKLHNLR